MSTTIDDSQQLDPLSKSPSRIASNSRSQPGRTSQPDRHVGRVAVQRQTLTEFPSSQDAQIGEEHAEMSLHAADTTALDTAQPDQPFQPFFTLIRDTVTNEHYHPVVHYIFADDDTDVLTEAACRSIELAENEKGMEDTTVEHHTSEGRDAAYSVSRQLQPQTGTREHYLILDIHPVPIDTDVAQGANVGYDRLSSPAPGSFGTARSTNLKSSSSTYPYAVTGVHSLSAEWQVTQAAITDAPTMNGDGDTATHDNFMLKISGSSNVAESLAMGRRDDESLEEVIEKFQRRLDEIQHLIQVDEAIHELEEDVGSGQGLLQQAGIDFGAAVLDEQD